MYVVEPHHGVYMWLNDDDIITLTNYIQDAVNDQFVGEHLEAIVTYVLIHYHGWSFYYTSFSSLHPLAELVETVYQDPDNPIRVICDRINKSLLNYLNIHCKYDYLFIRDQKLIITWRE